MATIVINGLTAELRKLSKKLWTEVNSDSPPADLLYRGVKDARQPGGQSND